MTSIRIRLCVLIVCLLCSCQSRSTGPVIILPKLVSINIVDRNGMTEIINNPERLEQYERTDFTQSQPYQKVLRVYSRDCQGNIPAIITSYHPNGTPHQYLEVSNSRACGLYKEWYPSGQMKLQARVIEGQADIVPGAEKSWIFDGNSTVWNEYGDIEAKFHYDKGNLTGVSTYYHKNGNVWKSIPYNNNQLDGETEIHYPDGALLQKSHFVKGVQDGESVRYWQNQSIAAQETYCDGLLATGAYYDQCGDLLCSITNGRGTRAVFNKDSVCEYQEYHNGVMSGKVEFLDRYGRIFRQYHVKDGTKHGEEICYYDAPKFQSQLQPKILMNWSEGKMQGTTKTWFENGSPESQKEISNNKKNGHQMAWYSDGSLMLIEEYEQDQLLRGEYYAKGEKFPVSMVIDGRGTATLYSADGAFLQKVVYKQGKPLLDE